MTRDQKAALVSGIIILGVLIFAAIIVDGCNEPPGQHPPKPEIVEARWTKVWSEGDVYLPSLLDIDISISPIRPNVWFASATEIDNTGNSTSNTYLGEYHFISESYGVLHLFKGTTLLAFGTSCNSDEYHCQMDGGGGTQFPGSDPVIGAGGYKRIN